MKVFIRDLLGVHPWLSSTRIKKSDVTSRWLGSDEENSLENFVKLLPVGCAQPVDSRCGRMRAAVKV